MSWLPSDMDRGVPPPERVKVSKCAPSPKFPMLWAKINGSTTAFGPVFGQLIIWASLTFRKAPCHGRTDCNKWPLYRGPESSGAAGQGKMMRSRLFCFVLWGSLTRLMSSRKDIGKARDVARFKTECWFGQHLLGQTQFYFVFIFSSQECFKIRIFNPTNIP